MTASPMSRLVHRLRTSADPDGRADDELLRAFVTTRDVAALAALVRRHGPMVWGVCRRLLGRRPAAEDAFQATFLVLVRKAAGLRDRAAVGNWLYGVAHRTAVRARAAAAKAQRREQQVATMPDPPAPDRDDGGDLRQVIDAELARLPDKYRAVVVLCDLEGLTRSDAARQLGIPEGTVAGRLARARAMLGERLVRRGVAGGAAAVGPGVAAAGVPPGLVSSTVGIATGPAGAVPAAVSALSQQVLFAMTLTKTIPAVLLVVAALGGAGGTAYLASGAPAAPVPKGPAEKPTPESELKKLQGDWKLTACTVRDGCKDALCHLTGEEMKGLLGTVFYRVRGYEAELQFRTNKTVTTTVLRLDPDASPAAVDVTRPKNTLGNGPEDATYPGIYTLDGDRFTIRLAHHGRPRPKAFDEVNDEKFGAVYVFERVRPEGAAPAPKDDTRAGSEKALAVAAAEVAKLAAAVEALAAARAPAEAIVKAQADLALARQRLGQLQLEVEQRLKDGKAAAAPLPPGAATQPDRKAEEAKRAAPPDAKPKLSAIRLGAKQDDVVAKYGKPVQTTTPASGIESLRFEHGPVRVLVEIAPASKQVIQIYYKKATPFTKAQVSELLERNAEGSRWWPVQVSDDGFRYERLDGGIARGGKVGQEYQVAVLTGSEVRGRDPKADADREKEKGSLKEIE